MSLLNTTKNVDYSLYKNRVIGEFIIDDVYTDHDVVINQKPQNIGGSKYYSTPVITPKDIIEIKKLGFNRIHFDNHNYIDWFIRPTRMFGGSRQHDWRYVTLISDSIVIEQYNDHVHNLNLEGNNIYCQTFNGWSGFKNVKIICETLYTPWDTKWIAPELYVKNTGIDAKEEVFNWKLTKKNKINIKANRIIIRPDPDILIFDELFCVISEALPQNLYKKFIDHFDLENNPIDSEIIYNLTDDVRFILTKNPPRNCNILYKGDPYILIKA